MRVREKYLKNVLLVLSIVFTIFTFSFSAALKVFRLENLQYTSDMFSYHQMAIETLNGNFGFDFTYGRHFGEHFFGWHILYTPIVWLTGDNSIYVYLLSGPIFFLIASLFVYKFFKVNSKNENFPWIALLLFSTQYSVLQYLQEPVYGFHFDTLAGFMFIVLVCVLDREKYNFFSPLFLALYLLLISIKQEFSAIAIILWFVMCLSERKRVYQMHFFIAILLFLLQMWVIEMSASTFNRTPEGLILRSFGEIFTNLNDLIFKTIGTNFIWFALSGIAIISAYFFVPPNKLKLISILYIAGGLKILTGTMLAGDPFLHTWHSAPAISVITFAFLLVCANVPRIQRSLLILTMFTASFWMYITYLPPNLQQTSNSQKKTAIMELKKRVPKDEIVAIQPYFSRLFLDRRYTFFPRGISMSPQGISDSIIIPEAQFKKWESQLSADFQVEAMHNGIYLLGRVRISDDDLKNRLEFFKLLSED